MDRDAILQAVEAERLGLADLLDGLDPGEWERKSLCAGWTVHDVVAHLTLATRLSPLAAIGGMLRARGDINRMIGDAARTRSARYGPAELVGQLRETAGSPERPLGTQPPDPLVDVLVHGQDIARPLGREREMPPERVLPAIEHVWSSSFYGARKRFDGLRFVATDADWSGGEGAREVSGPIGELLLLSTGRPAGLERTTGNGAGAAARRVQA
jgi:uncharacterized protein (TIGR03083 family)